MKGDVVGRRFRSLVFAVAVGLLLAGAGPPAEARSVQNATVELGSAAGLAPDGQSVAVQVLAKCSLRWTVVEALVAVSQQEASGQATFPLTCTGAFQSFTVAVPSSGAPFQLGQAQATASVVIRRGRTEQVQDSEVVTVE